MGHPFPPGNWQETRATSSVVQAVSLCHGIDDQPYGFVSDPADAAVGVLTVWKEKQAAVCYFRLFLHALIVLTGARKSII